MDSNTKTHSECCSQLCSAAPLFGNVYLLQSRTVQPLVSWESVPELNTVCNGAVAAAHDVLAPKKWVAARKPSTPVHELNHTALAKISSCGALARGCSLGAEGDNGTLLN